MSDLKGKVARIVSDADPYGDAWEDTPHKAAFLEIADRVLALPEIARALELSAIRDGTKRVDITDIYRVPPNPPAS